MQWTSIVRFKNPSHGDKKIRSKFLWFPKTIENETRWLQTAVIEYTYLRHNRSTILLEPLDPHYWIATKWVESY